MDHESCACGHGSLGVVDGRTGDGDPRIVPYTLPNPAHPYHQLRYAFRQPVIAPKPPEAVQVVVHIPLLVELKQQTPVVSMNWSQDLYEDPGFDTTNYTMKDIYKIQGVSAWGHVEDNNEDEESSEDGNDDACVQEIDISDYEGVSDEKTA
ncbi:hypothetical protein ACLMJK_004492 [Lecanora helva]